MASDAPETPTENADDARDSSALVPVRRRDDGWTPQRQRAFLEVLADTGSVSAAAQSVGMSTSSAYKLRSRQDAHAFSAAWNAALERAIQLLFPAAIDRALNGTMRQRFYHGELIGEERVHSDRLLVWLLEKSDGMLAGHSQRRAIANNWERAMDALEAGEAEPPLVVTREPPSAWRSGGRWLTNCPPPPGFRGFQDGDIGSNNYARDLTSEESAALERRREMATGPDEETRRRFFGLPLERPHERIARQTGARKKIRSTL